MIWPDIARAETPNKPDTGALRFRPDRILIKPKAGKFSAALAGLHSTHRNRVAKTFDRWENIQVVHLSTGQTVAEAVAQYQESGLVEFAEPDYILHATLNPNDPKFLDGTQWSFNNTGQNGGLAGADIHAPGGWETLSSASNIVVAVVDTGIRYTHEDLAANVWVNAGEIPGNGLDDDGNGYVDDVHGLNALANSGDPNDDNGHGTHVAGIIGAVGNNGKGVAGVAWRVQLMACKFLDESGNGAVSDAIVCIDYAVKHGAKIINASWDNSNYSLALAGAVRAARDAGVIVVAAAGNEAIDNDLQPVYPAGFSLDNIVAVAATTRADALDVSYSDFGAKSVDLAAPGTAIYSTWFTNSTAPGSSDRAYAYLSGTSMAAPHVTGALALMKARFPNETHQHLIDRLLAATDSLPSLAGKCVTGGRLNLQKALLLTVIADFTASPTYGTVPLTVQFTNTSFGTIASQSWDFGDGTPINTEPNPTHVFNDEGNFTVTLTVTGTNGVKAAKSRTITAIANYQIKTAEYQWIDPAGMTRLPQLFGSFTTTVNLPYSVYFYGRAYQRIFVSANGMFAFADPQFQTVFNSDLPNSFLPNAIVCPYWDSLNTLFGGGVYAGIVGTAPARRLVISWVNVPRTFSFNLPLTFQVVIEEETNRILFQYREVHPENRDGGGRQAAIGVENETGRLAAKYTYYGSPSIVTNGQAIQFVPAFSGSMMVTPDSGLEISGRFGGPFAPDNQTYTIENTGPVSINWAAAKTREWLSLSATNGLLAPGQSTDVLVALNSNALALKTGSYLDVISFFNVKNGNGNTTRAVALTVSGTNSVLAVTPDLDWRSAGPPGGPFSPASQIYTLMNSGDARLDWAANRSHDWISLSSSNGVLRPGESAVITLSIAPAATNLPPKSYTGRVDFVNGTSGLGNAARSVRLFVAQRPSLAVLTDTTRDRLSLRLNGDAGQSCIIETSTNLLKWVPMLTNSLAPGGWLDFADAPSSQAPRRFYRGKVLPP